MEFMNLNDIILLLEEMRLDTFLVRVGSDIDLELIWCSQSDHHFR